MNYSRNKNNPVWELGGKGREGERERRSEKSKNSQEHPADS